MNTSSLTTGILLALIAAALWAGVFYFANMVTTDAASSAQAIAESKRSNVKRDVDSANMSLLSETAPGRSELETVMNKDVVSLTTILTTIGTDAGIPLSVVNVAQGSAPKLPPGSILQPSSISFSVAGSGPFAKVLTAAQLLSYLPAASSLNHLVLSGGDSGWNINADLSILIAPPAQSP